MAPTSQTTPVTLRLARTLAAPREKVFRAWTSPAELKRWSAPGDLVPALAEVDLKVGGKYRIHMQAPDGTVNKVMGVYQVVDPPQRLVYTWSWETGDDHSETLVTVEFFERGPNRTEVVLTHERFPNTLARDRHQQGWTGCLDKFIALF